MIITPDTYIGEIVKMNFKTALLLQENNIDYCCGGSRTLAAACAEAGVDTEHLITRLKQIAESHDPDSDYINTLSLSELSDYIVKRHHSYVRKNIPFLSESLDKICNVHGTKHPELFRIRELFNESAGELTMHMQKEEIMLFPYIKKMEAAKTADHLPARAPFGSVSNPIKMMIAEHETEGERFDLIAEISGNYSIPADACNTYKATLGSLKEFESDLHRHIHLENNILFPGAIVLEESISGNL